nr:GGDEF domain-containing protein [Chromobacterium sp. ASV5]
MGKEPPPASRWRSPVFLAIKGWIKLGVNPELSGAVRRCHYMINATPTLVLIMSMFYLPIFLCLGNWALARTNVLQLPISLLGIAWFRYLQKRKQPPHYWKAFLITQSATLVGIISGQGTLLGTHFYFLLFFLTTPLVVPVRDRLGTLITCGVCLAWFIFFHYIPWPAAPEVQALPLLTIKALNLIVLLSASAILFIALACSEDFSDMLENRIRKMAITDTLTGLGNRRLFYSALARMRSRYEREEQPFCLAMLDIDFFKRINDKLGHEAGDEVLRHVSALLKSSIRSGDRRRPGDRVCRIGGEEFAILFANASLEQAFRACDAIRKAIADTPLESGAREIRVTASMGLAAWDATHSEQSFLAAADKALYCAKHGGRNQVQRHEQATTRHERLEGAGENRL